MSDKDIQISEPYERLGVEGQGKSQDARVKDSSARLRIFTEKGREYHIDRLT